jgi:hypothetical protein
VRLAMRRPRDPSSQSGVAGVSDRFLYVIGVTKNPVKVGMADNVPSRLAILQIGCPDELVVHHTVAVAWELAPGIEAAVHRKLAKHRRRGEWFDIEASHAVTVLHEEVRRRNGLAMRGAKRRGDVFDELRVQFGLSDWAEAAVADYRLVLNTPGGKPDIERRNAIVADAVGLTGLVTFQAVIVQRASIEATFYREPGAERRAKEVLAKALQALAIDYAHRRQEALFAQIGR